MSVALAVALLALLVALFALVALVAVYARVRALEAGRAAELSGYAPLVGRAAPAVVRPGPGGRVSVVAVLDADCAACHTVWDVLVEAAGCADGTRFVALVDRPADFTPDPSGRAALVADTGARADLFEGYTPTLLAVDAAGTVTHRSFVYPDTDLRALVVELAGGQEVSRA
ncbi:hypothetical protein [Pseudonocardia nigra]|uniref:hypothetical protein n=1 Tax=Pseudonocardia nigra TaxID=1921578 RepID=UPI001C5F167B|nr:hypothetical protein [Pseudonocardia nigra]